ncbi:FAD-binding oxidoreductase [Cupriavidus basilensis]
MDDQLQLAPSTEIDERFHHGLERTRRWTARPGVSPSHDRGGRGHRAPLPREKGAGSRCRAWVDRRGAGGAVPGEGDVVINLERMKTGSKRSDALEGVMQVRAGATLQQVQEAGRRSAPGLDVRGRPRRAPRGSCQQYWWKCLGRLPARIRVMRCGTMRDSVLGIEAVLPDGTVVSSLSRPASGRTARDWSRRFLFASEPKARWASSARLTLRLHPPMGDLGGGVRVSATASRRCRNCCARSSAASGFGDVRVRIHVRPFRQPGVAPDQAAAGASPAAAPWHVLIEARPAMSGNRWLTRRKLASSDALEAGEITDCALAASLSHREASGVCASQSRKSLRISGGCDARPRPAVERNCQLHRATGSALREQLPDAEHLFLGHLGDNNIHLISGPVDDAGVHLVGNQPTLH